MGRTLAGIEEDIRLEFSPIPVISSSDKVQNIIKRAVKFYSDNYSTEMMTTVSVPADHMVVMPDYVETVYKVFDVKQSNQYIGQPDLFQYFYLKFTPAIGRTLTFMEMISLFAFYQNAKDLFWPGQVWKWIKPNLFLQSFTNGFATVLFKYAYNIDDEVFEYDGFSYNWIFRYAQALVKKAEGTIIRKSKAVEMDSDGQEMIDDAEREIESLEQEIKQRNRLFLVSVNG